ncbi:MAG: methyltransferase [Rhodobacteraceae bacterium]|jgi:tRNA1(Val) A37 N6-methylase TrmN6|uniref:tRNA1(Val) (adenine(37)-N6)-methyltransferase n=1 Tax=Albidovulum sp. TaxID=1872424 RepID=UPI001DA280CA|nr:methyltransferase [uncultured Defluviimonas sp.]MCB2126079.1 methyltransferase [Paracoccaceae bacterium]MCC0071342.1 methyltransferase [Paracoccaceae bacterium]
MFTGDEITTDAFLGGRLAIAQPRAGYRAAADPVLLAAAVPARAGQEVLELGCGAGVASLCLGHRVPGLQLFGLELQPAYAALARRNAAANGQAFEVHEGDLAAMPAALKARDFDHVIANPPFFGAGTGTPARDSGRETAQREATPLAAWIGAGLRRLRPGGWLTLIQTAERLPEMLGALGPRAGSITVLPVVPRTGRPAGRIIMLARKGGRAPFRLLSPFVLHEGAEHLRDGDDYSPAARAVLREGGALPGLAP